MIRKGKPRRGWMVSVNVDLREKGLSGEETQNRAVWRQLVRYIDPPLEVGKDALEEKRGILCVFYEVLNYFSAVIDSSSRVCALLR